MIRRFILSLILAVTCLGIAPMSAVAFDPFHGACTNGTPKAQDSAACSTSNANPISGPQGILLDVTRIVAYLAGAIAIIMIIVAAIRFITSGSDVSTGSRTDTDIEEARRTISGALIGLAVIILAQAIIGYVIRRL
jgi:hypothetical protein